MSHVTCEKIRIHPVTVFVKIFKLQNKVLFILNALRLSFQYDQSMIKRALFHQPKQISRIIFISLDQYTQKASSSEDTFGELAAAPASSDMLDDDEVEFEPLVVLKLNLFVVNFFIETFISIWIAECVAMLEKRMPEDGVEAVEFNYNVVLGWLGRYGYAEKALQLYEQMKERRLKCNKHTYSSVLNALANDAKSNSEWLVKHVEILLRDARRASVGFSGRLTPAVYNAAIKAFARHGQVCSAFRVGDLMLKDGLRPGIDTFVHILQACDSEPEDSLSLVYRVWKLMLQMGVVPNTKAFNSFLWVCRRHFASLKKTNRTVMVSKLFDNLPAAVKFDDAEENNELTLLNGGSLNSLLSKMRQYGVDPDAKTFSLALDLLPDRREIEQAFLDILANNSAIKPDVTLLNAVILRRAKRGELELALTVLQEMSKYKLMPNENTFYCLAHGCDKRIDGVTLLQDAKKLNIPLSRQTYQTLLRRAFEQFNFAYAADVLQDMQRSNVQLTACTLRLIEQSLAKARQGQVKQERGQMVDTPDLTLKIAPLVQFKRFYKQWLLSMPLARRDRGAGANDQSLDIESVNTDDLREDWEKPWTKSAHKRRHIY
ncbi:Pentatricopeptide repeat-containing protein 1, mitochondrial [Trichinella pseudospiralis]|uniref:Pentatricopeptide repeat-containing protein 1, mitochondrial n=1 Tax=Trichinella pseudospiralis TaxID=6337 RepID=A0A0V0YCT2_TRIPS|nr:Pentatricopeptide repeat-containing protein 1, mitochondrial [Trichinella pseudospiralis]